MSFLESALAEFPFEPVSFSVKTGVLLLLVIAWWKVRNWTEFD